MSSIETVFLAMIFGLFTLALSCPNVNFKLRNDSSMQYNTMCSNEVQDISSPRKKVNLLSRDGAIGIYMKTNFTGQICYWKTVENGLISLGNLTGGTFYAVGKLELFVNHCWEIFFSSLLLPVRSNPPFGVSSGLVSLCNCS